MKTLDRALLVALLVVAVSCLGVLVKINGKLDFKRGRDFLKAPNDDERLEAIYDSVLVHELGSPGFPKSIEVSNLSNAPIPVEVRNTVDVRGSVNARIDNYPVPVEIVK